jgi:hypothetical protein
MNEELQKQLAQVISSIATSVGEVKDFSVSQLPDIAQQYINYGIVSSATWVVLCVIIAAVSIKVLIFSFKKLNEPYVNEAYIPVSFFSFIGTALSTFFFFVNVHDLIMVLTAPKVWFILQIKELFA